MKVLWKKTSGMLLRFPSLLVTIIVVSAITAITAVAGPAFLASTQRGSLTNGIEQAGRWTAGLRLTYPTVVFDRRSQVQEAGDSPIDRYYATLDRMMPALRERMENVPFLDEPELTLAGDPLAAAGPEGEATLRLMHRTDALQNVTKLESSDGDGIWIADVTAATLGVGVGDSFSLASATGRTEADVAGIYRYLPDEAPRDYWSPVSGFIYRPPDQFTDPPALIFAGLETHRELMTGLEDSGFISFSFPLSGEEMSFDDVRAIDEEFEQLGDELLSRTGPVGEAQGELDLNSPFGRGGGMVTVLGGLLRSAEERIAAVTPVVDLVSLAARLVAFSVMAAAGFFLVKKRRVEAASLAARGVSPFAQALRYGAEAFLPAVLGTIVGAALGYGLVAVLGPARALPPAVVKDADLLLVSSFVMGLALLVGAATLAVLREERSIAEIPPPFTGTRALAVASAVAVVAGVAAYSMRGSISAEDLEAIRDQRLTLVPVILILAGATVGAALLRAALPGVAELCRYRTPSLYLSARRLSGASGMTQVLITASACALGIAVYGLSVSSSIRDATVSKAHLFIGSDLSAQVSSSSTPPKVDFPLAHVTTFKRAQLASGASLTLMVVDPASFARAAYWKDSFADRSLDQLLDSISGSPGGPIEVLATADLGDAPQLTAGSTLTQLDIADHVRFFPGMPAEGEMAIMTRESFEAAIGSVGTLPSRRDELWARGEPENIRAALLRENILFASPITLDSVLESPSLQSLLWMLGLLSALGAAAGIISVFGLLLYLQARLRATLIASALTRRMGLSRRQEYGSWAAEIGGALLTAFLVAVAVGLPVAAIMRDRLDPRPALPPSPALIAPVLALAVIATALAAVAASAAKRLQRTVDRADIAEVLRT